MTEYSWDWNALELLKTEDRVNLLRELQPTDSAVRANWWRGALSTPKLHAMRPAGVEYALRWCKIANDLLDVIDQEGVFSDPDETLIDRSRLIGSIISRFGVENLPDWVDVNSIVRRILERAGDIDQIRDMVGDWQRRPIVEIRIIRRARNLVSPLRIMGAAINDRDFRDAVDRWVALYPLLP